MKQEIIDILKCPITFESLLLMDKEQIEGINKGNNSTTLFYSNGTKVDYQLDNALINVSGTYIYPILDGVIVLRKDMAIVNDSEKHHFDLRNEKKDVENFYNNIGWKHFSEKYFVDAEEFEDLRPVANEYFKRCNLRVKKYIKQKGKFILDAGSGPIQYDEYLTYSDNYDYRICVDLSYESLRMAKEKIGDKGIYILGDITNLPIKDNLIDAAVSLNVIFHIPMDEQSKALNEISRTLKPNHTAAVVYTWGDKYSLLMDIALFYIKLWQAVKKIGRIFMKMLAKFKLYYPSTGGQNPVLYFHAFPYSYFKNNKWSFKIEIFVWRSISVPFSKIYIHPFLGGKKILKWIYNWEEKHPKTAGKFGQYPLFVLTKQ